MRAAGVLMPIFSLPSKYAIGSFSKEAYDFIDNLKSAGQKYWQLLPLGPTGFGNSPYQSFSSYAGNPYFIDIEELIKDGLLSKEECQQNLNTHSDFIDYGNIFETRFPLLKKAYQRGFSEQNLIYNEFVKKNAFWLDDYSLFMAIKDYHGSKSFLEWEEDIKLRDKSALDKYKNMLYEDISFYKYIQFLFFKQWSSLKDYANKNQVKIIGDIPIYVALDSADCWANMHLFKFENCTGPKFVAGCPPDDFSPDGQKWGNPVYDWDMMKKENYKWWIDRIKHCFTMYDVVRIDHFRAFDEYYEVNASDKNAKYGTWQKGPGLELFNRMKTELGNLDIIAEDLGFTTQSVQKLLKDTSFPGMKILQFAFNENEKSTYLPCFYEKNCVVYTGTHDNDTIKGWFENLNQADKNFALKYLGIQNSCPENINWHFIRLAYSSVADICIIPISDYLSLGSKARINIPATAENNWTWRLKEGALTHEIIQKMKEFTDIYCR